MERLYRINTPERENLQPFASLVEENGVSKFVYVRDGQMFEMGVKEWLHYTGVLSPNNASFGVQFDINAALKRDGRSGSLCDHNCTTDNGNYTCPAASTLNPGMIKASMASGESIVSGILRACEGGQLANLRLEESSAFEEYCHRFKIPFPIETLYREFLKTVIGEVNLFGGNPEMHPEIVAIMTALRKKNLIVNFTTTGRRILKSEDFRKALSENPPNVLALSADDFESPERIAQLCKMSNKELYAAWKSVMSETPLWGQRQKAIEAIYAARWASELGVNAPICIFNLVMHQENAAQIKALKKELGTNFPNAKVNVFPAQSYFLHQSTDFTSDQFSDVERAIDRSLAEPFEGKSGYVPRAHYYTVLKAALNTYRDNPLRALNAISGEGIWKCYKTEGAGRYVQVGGGDGEANGKVSNHLKCFWNGETITINEKTVTQMSPDQIANYVLGGSTKIASEVQNPCPGCVFPRLMFDVISTELGLADELIPAYLDLRRQYSGF